MFFKDCLTFPSSSGRVSQSAVDLIRSLLTESENRLDYNGIRGHAFFADINFDTIRQSITCCLVIVVQKWVHFFTRRPDRSSL